MALQLLMKLNLTRADFDRHADGPCDAKTSMIVDGTNSHALERMLLYITGASGYQSRQFSFSSVG
jgi:hypothetical protein